MLYYLALEEPDEIARQWVNVYLDFLKQWRYAYRYEPLQVIKSFIITVTGSQPEIFQVKEFRCQVAPAAPVPIRTTSSSKPIEVIPEGWYSNRPRPERLNSFFSIPKRTLSVFNFRPPGDGTGT